MKSSKKWTQKLVVVVLPVLVGVTFARATPDETPCGVVMKNGKGAQLIPKQGSVQTKFNTDAPVSCGAMVITHQDPFWVRLSDQTVLKIAPQSFVEIPKTGSKVFHVYRGQVLVSAPPGITTQVWSTPNSESVFKGGIAFVQYQPETRVTTVSCFNRDFQFRNKFNEDAETTVHAGEMSHLAIQEANVNPSQPVVMNHGSVVQVLANMNLSESDQTELVASVKRVYQDRAKSLTSEIEDWESEPAAAEPARTIASVPAKVKGVAKPEKAIEPKEAEFVGKMMHDRLFGTESDQKMVDGGGRKPASVSAPLVDSEKQKQKQVLKQETKRLEKEIGQLRDDEE